MTPAACRGILSAKLGEHDKALADFSAVLAIDARNVSALYNRCHARRSPFHTQQRL